MRLEAVALAPLIGIGLVLALARGLDAQAPVPQPRAPLAVRGGPQGSSLLEVAQAYAGALGLELAAAPEVGERLARARVGLVADLSAPPEEVHAAAQALLLLGGFAVTGFEGGLALAAWPAQGVEPLTVRENDLARLSGHEGLVVRTAAHVEGLDARVAATALRALASVRAPMMTLAAPDDRTLVVSGPAGSVHALLAQVRSAVAPDAVPPAVDWDALFPAPGAGLVLEPADTLMSALERYVAATGLRMWVEPSLRAELAAEPTGLQAPLSVAPDRVHAVIEALLARRGVALGVLGSGRSALRVAQGRVQSCAPRPLLLDLEHEDAARLTDHPATLFGAAVHLPLTEVRTLTTSLRTLQTDTMNGGLMALADHTLVVQGTGASAALLGAVALGVEGRKLASSLPGTTEPPAPEAELVFAGVIGGGALADVLARCASALGEALVLGRSDRALVWPVNVPAAEASVLGTPDEVRAFIGRLLQAHDLALARLLDEPRLLALAAPGDPSGGVHRFVPVEELDAPGLEGLLVSTLLEVPHLEVRVIATRMRGTLAPGRLDHAIACGDHMLVLGGRLADVRTRVAELRALDAQAGR